MHLDVLLGIGRAFVTGFRSFTASLVTEVIHELDRSPLGRVIAQVISASSRDFIERAQDLAKEEAELAAKYQRDGKLADADAERERSISEERERIRKEFEAAKTREAASKLRESAAIATPITPDEISAVIGIVTLRKECSSCGAQMRIRQSGNKNGHGPDTAGRTFWWQCTAPNKSTPCQTITLNPRNTLRRLFALRMQTLTGQPRSDANNGKKKARLLRHILACALISAKATRR